MLIKKIIWGLSSIQKKKNRRYFFGRLRTSSVIDSKRVTMVYAIDILSINK